MHLSTVKVPIDFGIDCPRSSVLFLISNQLFFSKLCVSHSFASFCIHLVRPSPESVPHPTWYRTYTDSHECGQSSAMNDKTVYLYILVRPLEFQPVSTRQLALVLQAVIGFRHIIYASRMSKFYMPTLINHRNNSKTEPISLYFVRVSSWGSLLQRYF